MIVPERGFKRKLKDMAMANAKKYLSDKKLQWEYQDAREQGAVKKLKELLILLISAFRNTEIFFSNHSAIADVKDFKAGMASISCHSDNVKVSFVGDDVLSLLNALNRPDLIPEFCSLLIFQCF